MSDPCTTCSSVNCPGAPRFKGICSHQKSPMERAFEYFIDQRGVETPCTKCRGLGTRSYASTSTWRGGMGGSMVTSDVCDHCWGSGDEDSKWPNLRSIQNEQDSKVAARAAEFLSNSCGFGMSVLNPGLDELATELEAFHRQRRARPQGFHVVASCLAKALRQMAAASRKEEDARRRSATTKKA
jgi:hypothetical protein